MAGFQKIMQMGWGATPTEQRSAPTTLAVRRDRDGKVITEELQKWVAAILFSIPADARDKAFSMVAGESQDAPPPPSEDKTGEDVG